MNEAKELARKARECLGAAQMLAERFPSQAMEMLARSVETALRAGCATEGILFDAGDDHELMVRFVPEGAWATVSRDRVVRLMDSCRAWLSSGRTDGDFMIALHADMSTAQDFVGDAEACVYGRGMAVAAAA